MSHSRTRTYNFLRNAKTPFWVNVKRRVLAQGTYDLRSLKLGFNTGIFFEIEAQGELTRKHTNGYVTEVSEQCNEEIGQKTKLKRTAWGYMVKRISAYGGCLGGRRR